MLKLPRILLSGALWLATILTSAATADDAAPGAAFVVAVNHSFPKWDSDHDGVLSAPELDTALGDPVFTGDAGAALAVIKRLSRRDVGQEIPKTVDGLSALAAGATAPRGRNVAALFTDARKRIARTTRELFATGAPALESLRQGEMGNCFSLAPLGAMLSRDAGQVRAMFRQNADGAFTVRIGKQEVTVAPPTDAEVALSSSSESTGLWSNVYEKAAGVACNQLRKEPDRVTAPLDALARGGSAGTMLAFITGHEMERFTLKWAKGANATPPEFAAKLAELRAKLRAAFAAHQCVTTGTLKPALPGLRGNHAYGVIGYDAATDEIRVWDPHGDTFTPQGAAGAESGFPREDGICALPLPIFVTQFSGLAFEILAENRGQD